MTIITLTTDFGLVDGYVGTMKGVILRIAPQVRLVDLTHDIAPQNINQAAFVLARSAPYFPPGTIHLAVVDPGVGSARRALLGRTEGAYFVGPDNGLLAPVLAQPDTEVFVLDQPRYWLSPVSRTFHGRDIFAPVAAHLAQGVQAEALGTLTAGIAGPSWPQARRTGEGNHQIAGHVIYVDRFGNLVTNVPAEWLTESGWRCTIAGRQIERLHDTYADAAPGALLALIGSGGSLEISIRDGDAHQSLGVKVGAPVLLSRTGAGQQTSTA